MSATHEKKNISVKVDQDFLDDFDRAIKRAQAEGDLPLNMSRSEAIRRLMHAAVDDPTLLAKDGE